MNNELHENKTQRASEEEINLIDLWLVLVRRKLLLITVVVISSTVGLIFALMTPKVYTYKTTVEIGNRISNDKIQSIEDPRTLLAKIQESYIPLAQRKLLNGQLKKKNFYNVFVRVPPDSDLIVLESKGKVDSSQEIIQLQKSIVDMIKSDHKRILDIVQKEIQIERNKAQYELADLQDEATVLKAKEKRLDGVSLLLKKQIESTENYIENVSKNRLKALSEVKSEAKALTLLMLDTDVQQQRKRLAELEERLLVNQAEERATIEKKLADNARAQESQRDQISRLEAQLLNLRATRVFAPPMQSHEPSGKSRKSILVLSTVIGVILAVFIVFFAEFLSNVRTYKKQNVT